MAGGCVWHFLIHVVFFNEARTDDWQWTETTTSITITSAASSRLVHTYIYYQTTAINMHSSVGVD